MSARVEGRAAGVRFQFDRQRRLLTPGLAHIRREGEHSWALREIDLDIGPGEGVGLVGATGSGKTTLLRLLAGILVADEGRLDVQGRIGTLLSTSAGLIGALTGDENTKFLGALNGLTSRDARSAIPAVKELSGLGASFERPVASYSQGMRARLGFAVAAQRDIDVLLLDEVHEALDHEFRAVVAERVHAIRARGGLVVAAGHDHAALETMCDRAVWLRRGQVVGDGPFAGVVGDYVTADAEPVVA
jgi:ABC-type polysaccharide/polyol phosphate transport system ATPase subunit